jgi:hypothetical protein
MAQNDQQILTFAALRPIFRPGLDVMIAMFSDFHQFSANNWPFFSETNVLVKFLQN